MKTKFFSIITILAVILSFTVTANASSLKDAYTVLSDISAIDKIEVHGNVELFISDAAADQVKVYDNYYSESALVQNKNGVLSIASYKNQKLIVWVSANDLRSVSAYDNAQVKSFGKLSKIEFNVELHDNASAKLNLDAFNASLTVKDNAKADLTGSANQLNLNRDIESNVKSNNFAVIQRNENRVSYAADLSNESFGM